MRKFAEGYNLDEISHQLIHQLSRGALSLYTVVDKTRDYNGWLWGSLDLSSMS